MSGERLTAKPCPWCGSAVKQIGKETLRDGSPSIDWMCGSFKYGKEPHQDENCEHNVTMIERDNLEIKVAGLECEVETMRRQLISQRKEISDLKAALRFEEFDEEAGEYRKRQ